MSLIIRFYVECIRGYYVDKRINLDKDVMVE